MANTYLTRTCTAGNRRKWTWSAWIKRTATGTEENILTGYEASTTYTELKFNASDELQFQNRISNTWSGELKTNRKFRDVNAWYHIVIVWDSENTNSAAQRMRMYINGVEESSFATRQNPSNPTDSSVNWASRPLRYGSWQGSNRYFNGLMSHVHFIDGTVYTPSAFGETDSTTGEWKIKTSVSVTYGTNGSFILKDGNSVTDQSGQTNNFTVGGGTLTATEDCPSDVFCTFNPLHQGVPDRELIYSNGNGTITASTNNWQPSGSTLAVPPKTGKWYWEFSQFVSSQFFVGLMASNCQINTALPYECLGLMTYFQSGRLTMDNSATEGYFTAISNQTDVVGVALDMTAGTYGQAQFYHNGSATGAAVALTSNFANQFVMPFGMCNGSTRSVSLNAGNGYFGTTAISSEGTNASGIGKFEYDVPANHKPISTKGLNA